MSLTIREIEIKDIFGTAHQHFRPGTLTVVSGENGAGKTSILQALLIPFTGGHDPAWLRGWPENPAKKGFVRFGLSDGVTVAKNVTVKGSELVITSPDGLPVKAPKEYLEALGNAWAVSPGALLSLDTKTAPGRKKLAEELLKILPLSFRPEDICLQHSEDRAKAEKFWYETGGQVTLNLEVLDKLAARITEHRRIIGHDRDRAEETVQTIRGSLPPEEGKDWNVEVTAAQQEKAALQSEIRSRERRLDDWKADEHRRIDREHADKMRQLSEEFTPKFSANTARLTAASERASEAERIKGNRDLLASNETRQRERAAEYESFSRILEAIAKARLQKLKDLPVSGLTFHPEAGPLLDGVPWGIANTQRRIFACMEIMGQRVGKLPFVIWDEEALLDAAHRKELEAAAIEAGYQVMVARVSDGPLTITPISPVGQQPDGTLIVEK